MSFLSHFFLFPPGCQYTVGLRLTFGEMRNLITISSSRRSCLFTSGTITSKSRSTVLFLVISIISHDQQLKWSDKPKQTRRQAQVPLFQVMDHVWPPRNYYAQVETKGLRNRPRRKSSILFLAFPLSRFNCVRKVKINTRLLIGRSRWKP